MSSVAINPDKEFNTIDEAPGARTPLVTGDPTYSSVTESVARVAESKAGMAWWLAFGFAASWLTILGIGILYLIATGVGIWGHMSPVYWGWPIVNFVFWVGIGHAGTLISAILYLFRQTWRTGINRFAEAMTIFAVMCAGVFPAIHVGRIWVIYWVFPYPNQMALWPHFRSPLMWDVFAVSTYFTVSLLFWYMGLIPDFATLRDRAKNKISGFFYGLFALGWTGSSRHWHRYEVSYMLLAGLAAPLVLSVHTVVSMDFAVSQLPGWHTTIFPPYFVAGAIFGGFGMVVTLAVPARAYFGLQHIITLRHMENMCKVITATGTMVGYAYLMESFIAWYGGNPYEQFAFYNRAFGPYWWAYWSMFTCNAIIPQIFWFKWARTTPWVMFVVSIFVNIGMWYERFVICCTSLHRDFLPSSWGYFTPTIWDWLFLIGSFGMFLTLFLLFCKFLPVIAIAEIKGVISPPGESHTKQESAAVHS